MSTAGVTLGGCSGAGRTRAGPSASDDDDTGAGPIDCEPTGHQTEGPYYPGEPAELLDITGGRGGVPMRLRQ